MRVKKKLTALIEWRRQIFKPLILQIPNSEWLEMLKEEKDEKFAKTIDKGTDAVKKTCTMSCESSSQLSVFTPRSVYHVDHRIVRWFTPPTTTRSFRTPEF